RQRAYERPDIGVVWGVKRCQAAMEVIEVVQPRPVPPYASERRFPCMDVGVDQSRHHDASVRVDDAIRLACDMRSEVNDAISVDEYSRLLEIADPGVQRKHAGVLNQNAG